MSLVTLFWNGHRVLMPADSKVDGWNVEDVRSEVKLIKLIG